MNSGRTPEFFFRSPHPQIGLCLNPERNWALPGAELNCYMVIRPFVIATLGCLMLAPFSGGAQSGPTTYGSPETARAMAVESTVARQWNEDLLEAIRGDFARPTVHARNLFHFSVACFDAFAAYDDLDTLLFLGQNFQGYSAPFDPALLTVPTDEAELFELAQRMLQICDLDGNGLLDAMELELLKRNCLNKRDSSLLKNRLSSKCVPMLARPHAPRPSTCSPLASFRRSCIRSMYSYWPDQAIE